MTNTDERVGLVARAIEREAEECGFSIFSGDAESIARAVLSALRGQGEGWQAIEDDAETVERVARAFCDAEADYPIGYFPNGEPMRAGGVWGEYMENQHEEWRRLARVAIATLRPAPPSQTGGDDGR